MTTPTLTHIDAADGTHLVVTTRIKADGTLQINVYRNDDKNGKSLMGGNFTARTN